MEHSFDIYHAQHYGLNEAIMIKNFQFWINKNKANGSHQYDERTWTYNSVKAFEELFPYLKPSQIRRCLESLVEQGVLIKGEYNKNPYDRTSWFAFNNESTFLIQQLDLSNLTNGDLKFANSHTDTKPNTKPNNKKEKKEGGSEEMKEWLKKGLEPYLEKYGRDMLNNFYAHWVEASVKGDKIRMQEEKFFDIPKRLATWHSRSVTKNTSAAPRPAVPASQSPMANQDNHSNYADYVAWCEKNNISPQPDKYANDSYLF